MLSSRSFASLRNSRTFPGKGALPLSVLLDPQNRGRPLPSASPGTPRVNRRQSGRTFALSPASSLPESPRGPLANASFLSRFSSGLDLSGFGSGMSAFGSGGIPDTPGRTPGAAARTLSVSMDQGLGTNLNNSSMLSLSPMCSPSPIFERDRPHRPMCSPSQLFGRDANSPLWRAPRNQETPGKGWEGQI